jgi:hypothetical protein
MKIETVSFRTGFKNHSEILAKNDGMTLTMFINECIRKELEKRTAFLADVEARKLTAKEMGIMEIADLSLEKISAIMAKEVWDEFLKKWTNHHTRIETELNGRRF